MTISAGSTTTTANFTPTNDSSNEGNETATIAVSGVSGGSATESGDQSVTITITDDDNFSFSVDYIRSLFYMYFNSLITDGGRKEALQFVCLVVLCSVFLANLFRYFSAVILARVRVRVVTNLRKSLYNKIIKFKAPERFQLKN